MYCSCRLQGVFHRHQLAHEDAIQRPAMRLGDDRGFFLGFRQRNIHRLLAATHAFEQELECEGGLSRSRHAFNQVEAVRSKPAVLGSGRVARYRVDANGRETRSFDGGNIRKVPSLQFGWHYWLLFCQGATNRTQIPRCLTIHPGSRRVCRRIPNCGSGAVLQHPTRLSFSSRLLVGGFLRSPGACLIVGQPP